MSVHITPQKLESFWGAVQLQGKMVKNTVALVSSKEPLHINIVIANYL